VPSRRKSREFVLQVLFAADAGNKDPMETFDFLGDHFSDEEDEDLKMHRVLKDFARDLVQAVSENKEDIDALIARLSHHWKLTRINRVDRNILRMAIAEFTSFHEVPSKVILNEAIEIGKKFGAENSAAFINGILDRVHVVENRPTSAEQLLQLLQKLD
jgi:N utilization substance protein B